VTDPIRVDVSGTAIYVRSDFERRFLEQTNSHLARMKMALHRIAGGHSEDPQADALSALKKAVAPRFTWPDAYRAGIAADLNKEPRVPPPDFDEDAAAAWFAGYDR
jgi:hypothetical protein